MQEPGTLNLGEPHPSAYVALEYIRANQTAEIVALLESLAADGYRAAEVCFVTWKRLGDGLPVSDRYIMGLAWMIHDIKHQTGAERKEQDPQAALIKQQEYPAYTGPHPVEQQWQAFLITVLESSSLTQKEINAFKTVFYAGAHTMTQIVQQFTDAADDDAQAGLVLDAAIEDVTDYVGDVVRSLQGADIK